jgi:CheY-like chemotaxis protein
MLTETIVTARPFRILFVEDNLGDAVLLLKYMRGLGIPNRVTVLRDGLEVLDYLKRRGPYSNSDKIKRPDLIVLDLNLPLMDGREVLRAIKGDPEFCRIPILVFTGSFFERDMRECLAAQADHFMIKPADLDQYEAFIRYLEFAWMRPILSAEKAEVR